ncbi:GntR family transcriptional regulator [Kitasatospora sp. NPDC006697]|uniref:GntR family transcriptional regulator n=1 Tax=Kitasatospora sp. NPDC006697 TaxID=3364020 RepID=UPI0036AB8BE2
MTSKYQLLADTLRAAIATGEYGPGAQLPPERALASQFGVSPGVVRQALGLLRDEGLVEARATAGIFVREPFAPIRRHGIQRLAQDRWGSGASIWSTDESRSLVVDQLMVEEHASPPASVATALELAGNGDACLRSRRFVVAGRPVLLSWSYLPQSLVAGSQITQPDTGPGGTYARLTELGAMPVHFREELRCRPPQQEEAERLSLSRGVWVIQIVRTAWAENHRPVEVNVMVLDSQAYVLDYEFDS